MEIHFGALAPPLSEQLRGCGLRSKDIKHFQESARAITRLHVLGLIPDGVAHNARKKLIKKIEKAWKGHKTRLNED